MEQKTKNLLRDVNTLHNQSYDETIRKLVNFYMRNRPTQSRCAKRKFLPEHQKMLEHYANIKNQTDFQSHMQFALEDFKKTGRISANDIDFIEKAFKRSKFLDSKHNTYHSQ